MAFFRRTLFFDHDQVVALADESHERPRLRIVPMDQFP